MTTKVKGAVILARKAFVEQTYGAESWNQVLEALSEIDQEELEGFLLTSTWYPFELNLRLDQAIVDVLGEGADEILESIGASSARENLSGPHKHFLIPGDPMQFMTKADRIYKFYYDTGYREFEATGASSGVMTTHEAETFSATDCLTVIGWYKEALKMCGAQRVTMTEETCRATGGPYCRYLVSWEQ